MRATLTEAVVEDAALDWLKNLGWMIAHGPDIAPGAATAERTDYGQVILEQRLRERLGSPESLIAHRCPQRRLSQANPPGRRNPRSTQPHLSTGCWWTA